MSQTYAKMINEATISATVVTSNGIPFIQFFFQVYENINIVNETYDSYNDYTYVAPISKFYIDTMIPTDSPNYNQVNLKFGDSSVSFNQGDYVNTDGTLFNPSVIVSLINFVLNYTP